MILRIAREAFQGIYLILKITAAIIKKNIYVHELKSIVIY